MVAVSSTAPIVLCPLVIETALLRRAGLSRHCRLECCGPGAEGVERWAAANPGETVILAGLAGSVAPSHPAGRAYAAAVVIDDDDRRCEPTLKCGTQASAVVGSSLETLRTPQAKKAWAEQSGADLVDRESAAFARVATQRGWLWSVVRGVSDGPETTLPADVDRWIDSRGRTRYGAVLSAILLRRVRGARLSRLRADSVTAMKAAAEVVRRMLEDV